MAEKVHFAAFKSKQLQQPSLKPGILEMVENYCFLITGCLTSLTLTKFPSKKDAQEEK